MLMSHLALPGHIANRSRQEFAGILPLKLLDLNQALTQVRLSGTGLADALITRLSAVRRLPSATSSVLRYASSRIR